MAEKTVPARTEKEVPVSREETREFETHLHPPVDIYETEDGLTVVADMPGVAKGDLQVNVDDSVLTIQGRTRQLATGEPVWSEYKLLNFYRQFQLPDEIDQEKINADLKSGILTIHLPRAEKAKPKKIEVQVG